MYPRGILIALWVSELSTCSCVYVEVWMATLRVAITALAKLMGKRTRKACFRYATTYCMVRCPGVPHATITGVGEGCKGDGRFISTMGVFLLEGSLDQLF